MKAKTRKVRHTKVRTKRTCLHRDIIAAQQSIEDKFTLVDIERKYLLLQRDYDNLRMKLTNLLLPEQIDAARTCGVTPEVYALEWIDIFYKDKVKQYAAAYGNNNVNPRSL
jgi:hypothetical protein